MKTHIPARPLLAAAFLFGMASLSAQPLPAPLPLEIPKADPAVVFQKDGQIAKLTLKQKAYLAPVNLPKAFGDNYTLTFWVRLDDTPALRETGFTPDAPVTLIDLSSPDWDDQRTTLRVHGGRFSVTALNEGKWKMLAGVRPIAEPETWYFLAYAKSGGKGAFYMNGDIMTRTPADAPVQDKIQNIVFGNFQKQRRLQGVILQPRLYPAALDMAQIQSLHASPPAEVK
ncbi:LamG domain-containing protein [Termitidicoccus mucosus]|uniref:LamG-like jellyroll fold domain-containing protein n=1 Tax=Termitidicoccus mucosus TaxID=1184151 RepID=A0A178IKY1_9BACT|nr:hypothetical protein AW736_00455 [Opitutaceae bacterium TSB47]